MFFYLIYNSSFIKKDNEKNKNVNTLIYGSIVYVILHALIYANKSLRESILRYFWIILSVDVVSMFLSTEISSDIQKHNLTQDAKTLLRKKKKRKEIINDPLPVVEKYLKKHKIKEHNPLKEKNKENDIEETQNILNQIEQDSKELGEEIKKKKTVKFADKTEKSTPIENLNPVEEDEKSELSDGSDLELDLESFEKSLLED
jgi:hypothetical protein